MCNEGGCAQGVCAAGGAQVGGSAALLSRSPSPSPAGAKMNPLGLKLSALSLVCFPLAACRMPAQVLLWGGGTPRHTSWHTTTHHGTPWHTMAQHGTHWRTVAASRLLTQPVPTAWPRGSRAPRRLASPGLMPLHAEPQSLLALPASAWSQEQAGRVAAGLPASWQLVGGTCASCTDV